MKLVLIQITIVFFLAVQLNGQSIANYVTNGSFEEHFNTNGPNPISLAKGWRTIDSVDSNVKYYSVFFSSVPYNGGCFQWPKSGNSYGSTSFYSLPPQFANNYTRGYFRNRLKRSLTKNESYCVSFFINIRDISSYGIDRFEAFFTDDQIDSVHKCTIPLTYYYPQISNSNGNIISDTLNWIKIYGIFKATGNEKHLIIGNFRSDQYTDTILINTSWLPNKFCDINLDDVSCIPIDLPAYAGPDKSCKIGDSVYVGRERDFAIDPGCTWFKLPNMSVPIATASGIWVKPTVTTTYVVKQVLDCSSLKYDTVIVYPDFVSISILNSTPTRRQENCFLNTEKI
ncbi:MAG: hypothetical protein WCR21_05875 [Bacteroidota bacterium]